MLCLPTYTHRVEEHMDATTGDSIDDDTSLAWCQLCERRYHESCPDHGLPLGIVDKPILPLAEASLPTGLNILKDPSSGMRVATFSYLLNIFFVITTLYISLRSTGNCIGVTAKRHLRANTMFGPIIAPSVSERDQLSKDNRNYPICVS